MIIWIIGNDIVNTARLREYYGLHYPNYQIELRERHAEILEEERTIGRILGTLIHGSVIDIGAGAGYWLTYFLTYVTEYFAIEITEQSCARLRDLTSPFACKSTIVHADAFKVDYSHVAPHDFAFLSFFISHFSNGQILELLKRIQGPETLQTTFVIVDSLWTDERRAKVSSKSLQLIERKVGNKRFKIPKRYIDEYDLDDLASSLDRDSRIIHEGKYWLLSTL